MKAFMDKEFVLRVSTAQHLYHDYAADAHLRLPLPHPSPPHESRRFENIARCGWAAGPGRQLLWRPLQVARDALQRCARAHHR